MCIKKEIRDMYFLTYCPRGGKIIKIIHLFVLYGFLYIRHFSLSVRGKGSDISRGIMHGSRPLLF